MTMDTIPQSNNLDRVAYIDALINAPWQRDGMHCWALVAQVQRDLFGRALPPVIEIAPVGIAGAIASARLFRDHPERLQWREAECSDGAVVLMASRAGNRRDYRHAGVAVQAGPQVRILHSDDPHGAVLDSLIELQARGWHPTFLLPR